MQEIIKVLQVLYKIIVSYLISTKVDLMRKENKYLKNDVRLKNFKFTMLKRSENEIKGLKKRYEKNKTKKNIKKLYYRREKYLKIKNNQIKIIDLSQFFLEISVYTMLILTSLNIAWQIKVLNYHIYLLIFVGWVTFIIVWMSIVIIRWITLFFVQITKKFYIGTFYLHIKLVKIIFGIILLCLANFTFKNYTLTLLKKNQSFLILESDDIDKVDLLKNSTIEILNENNHFKWSVDKNGKIISPVNKIEGNYRVENLLVKENSSLMLYYEKNKNNFDEGNSDLKSQRGEYIDLKNNVVKIFSKDKVYTGNIISGKIIKLSNGIYLPLNSSYRYFRKSKGKEIFIVDKKLKNKKKINYVMFLISVILVLLLTLKDRYYDLEFITKEKIMYHILQREKKYPFEVRKLVLSILKIIRMATAIYIPLQVYLLRNIVFSLFLEKSLYKINKNINLLFSLLFSQTFLLTILIFYGLRKLYKILRVIAKIIYEEGSNDLRDLIEDEKNKIN
ncbi:hypothetical protein [Leptotrichia sp. oral taxon 847]|uniref:hypothetical protein n=1 Tax=Leptotrichia sp. oral taxon 847 TaxID=1785996 RepID=UPI0007680DD1|nr:hypothetical protein [Leptotrichia sp. oral taxon 847]AMD94846.1 hypothetical protein AXF11_04055 [Leptotrichia sp. oral taxon 847]